jgi:hypothetical protein
MKVRIKKLSPTENPDYPSANKESYKCGSTPVEEVSVFVDYEVEGYISERLTVGSCIYMHRTSRNGVEVGGVFQTSPITKVVDGGFHTRNSVYEIEVLQ